MAELQWIIEVRCTNALLAEMKVGERGEHIIAHVPERNLDPAEFDKLIEGAEAADRLAAENRKLRPKSTQPATLPPLEVSLGEVVEMEGRHNLYQAHLLTTGELIYLKTHAFFAPSEFKQLILELKTLRSRMQAAMSN
jgi:hypothetical protein